MNGKSEKAVHIVDKAAKTKAVNKKVNKVFKRNTASEWSFVPSFYIDGLKMIGNVLFIPVVLIVAVLEGIRAGFIAGMQKALTLYRT
jgi:hypothetical protein